MRAAVRAVAVTAVVTALLVLCLEGFASLVLLVGEVKDRQIIAERIHTTYDPLLGWVNKPSLHIPDMYGEGIGLTINAGGFRSDHDFSASPPPEKRRWICTGDSFAFGYGVDDENTWCTLLESIVPGLETVNMGQGGYGIDQAYLWYERDATGLDHEAVLFTFITDDFARVPMSRFLGYPKPLLGIHDGRLVQENFPVPPPDFLRRHVPRYEPALRELQLVRLIDSIAGGRGRFPEKPAITDNDEVTRVILAVLDSLHDLAAAKGRKVVLIHLPMEADYRSTLSDAGRSFLKLQSRERGWAYVDLIEEFRRLPPHRVPPLFIAEDIPGYVDSSGHYTVAGNRYIAGLLARTMAEREDLEGLVSGGN